ncbi:MAG: hypothetical protein WC981_01280 [Candidatus Dojkabacteria bacterium]
MEEDIVSEIKKIRKGVAMLLVYTCSAIVLGALGRVLFDWSSNLVDGLEAPYTTAMFTLAFLPAAGGYIVQAIVIFLLIKAWFLLLELATD